MLTCPHCNKPIPNAVRKPGRPRIVIDGEVLARAQTFREQRKSLRWISQELGIGKDTLRAILNTLPVQTVS